jgi:hypothetical protein
MSRPQTFTMWRKSSRSSGGGNCVEVAIAPNGPIGVRDSKDTDGAVLTFSPAAWMAFITRLRNGDLQLSRFQDGEDPLPEPVRRLPAHAGSAQPLHGHRSCHSRSTRNE